MKLWEGACLLTEGHVSKRLRTYHSRSIQPTPVITPTSASRTQEAAPGSPELCLLPWHLPGRGYLFECVLNSSDDFPVTTYWEWPGPNPDQP